MIPLVQHRRPVSALSILISLGLIAVASAQAQNTSSPDSGSVLAPVVVTATRSPQSSVNLVSDVDSVATRGMRSSAVLSLSDLLGTLSGSELARNGGPGAASSIFLRGASSGQSLFLIDGFRVSSASVGSPSYGSAPFGMASRLEVLRGPASGLYGADAIGGVIQLFTPTARQGLHYQGNAAVGSLGTRQLAAGVSGGSGRISAGLQLSRDKSDGFNAQREGSFGFNADDDGYEREGLLAHVTAQLTPQSELRGIFLRSDVDSEFDNGAFEGAIVRSRTEVTGITSESTLSDSSVVTLKVGRSKDSSDTESSFPSRFETVQDQIRLALRRAVAPGTEMQLHYERLNQGVETVSYGPDAVEERKTNSYGVALTGRENNHIVQLSFRRDKSNQYDEQSNGTFTYGYMLSPALRVGGGYSTGFRAPSFNDLYFPGYGRQSIKPETSRNFEIGAYWDQRSKQNPGGWQGKAIFFDNRIKDLIVYAPTCPDNDPQFSFGCADNVNVAQIRGLSFSLGRQHGGFGWKVNADFLDPQDQTLDKQLVRRAKRQLSAQMGYRWQQFSVASVFKAAGHRFNDAQNTTRLGGYATANLKFAYHFSKNMSTYLNIINASDKDYSTAGGYNSQPRTFMLGFQYQPS